MKKKVMVPPRLIRRTETRRAGRLAIESGGKRRALRAPTSPGGSDEGMGERDAERGDKKMSRRGGEERHVA